MESKLKTFLLFLCLFNFVFLVEYLNPNGEVFLTGTKDTNFNIHLDGEYKDFADYIDIKFNTEAEYNPMIFIANDKNCEKERLYAGVQISDPIYSFIKKEQIKNYMFNICIKSRENLELKSFNITIKNEQAANIPLDSQASYYISDTNAEKMNFIFPHSDDLDPNSNVTFWVKGKKFSSVKIDNNELKEYPYDNGYVYYGSLPKKDTNLVIESHIGNYVTIGSTIISDGKTHEMKVNANEMMIATEGQVCIPLKFKNEMSHIEGKLYTKKATFAFTDDSLKPLSVKDHIIQSDFTNGIISDYNAMHQIGISLEEGYYCLTESEKSISIFDIQMVNHEDFPLVNAPLIPGEIRQHFLRFGQIGIFYGMKPNDEATEGNLNIKILKGFPEMYFDECKTFPYCNYDYKKLETLANPVPSNMITVYSFYMNESSEYKEFNSISSFQPLMIVYCKEGGKKEFPGEDIFCEFQTSFFTNMDTIFLIEETTFSQYLLKGEEDKYKINLEGEKRPLLYLDMLLFSGDANIELSNFRGEGNKYYLSNKIYYSVHLDGLDSLEFTIKASSNSFYMIQYQFEEQGDENDKNTIESGVNYITSKFLDEDHLDSEKFIDLINFKYEHKQPYLVSLYSPNCQFDLSWIDNSTEKVIPYGNIAQMIIDNQKFIQEKNHFFYNIQLEEGETEKTKKFCMVYVSGLEISNSTEEYNGRSISLPEAVPHRYTFSPKYPFIFYSYHVSDQEKTLVLNFKLIDKTLFDIDIKINRKYYIKTTIYRNSQIYIGKDVFGNYCEEQEVCTVLVTVVMVKSERDRRVELTMYQIDSAPLYLEKNVAKQDIIHGNKVKHYYFEIGKGDYGDITLNFKRGSGNIYACVVKRVLDTPMENPDWRGLYHFPMTIEESLEFKTYGKKIMISDTDTNKCDQGCYVLISVVSNSMYYGNYDDETAPFRISITPRIIKTDVTVSNPKVKIDVNEYVIGDIINSNNKNRTYDYYTVTCPFESDYIIIDWQANAPLFLINYGEERPTKGNAHIQFPPLGIDFVYKISRQDLLDKAGVNKNESLRGKTLTLGIYSETNDSIQSSPYAFKIFMPPIVEPEHQIALEIIHIRSDQKVQCLPFELEDNEFLCMFAVIVDDIDVKRNLVVYPRSTIGSPLEIYGQLTDAESIEINDVWDILELMGKTYNDAYKYHGRYIYVENIKKNESYFFIVKTKDSNIIEVMSSSQVYYENVTIYPNPSTAQIFATQDKDINLNFVTTKDLLLNIVSVAGTSTLFWDDEKGREEKYYLRGFNDRLSLTTYTDDKEKLFAPLQISTKQFINHEKAGFVFYITHYPRSGVDQLRIGRNIEFHYRTLKMPLYYYAPIISIHNYTVNFNFYDIKIKTKEDLVYDTNLFNIWATVITDEEIMKTRTNPGYQPQINPSNMIKGIFDSSFGNIFLSQKDISRINKAAPNETINLYFSVEKTNNVKYEFDSLGYEINILTGYEITGEKPASEGIYITGKLSQSSENRMVYALHCNEEKPYLRIEYAANSDYVQFALSENITSEKNDKFENGLLEIKNGRNILTVKLKDEFFNKTHPNSKLYFIVFTKKANLNKKLDYFTFKYLFDYVDFDYWNFLSEKKSEISFVSVGNEYTISFYPLEFTDVSYFVKAIYKNELTEGENVNTIALSESKGKYMYIDNPPFKKDTKMSVNMIVDKEVSYFKIMARFNLNDQNLFFLYKPIEYKKEAVKEISSSKTLLYVSISIGSIFLVTSIVLVVFIFVTKNKNKDLLGKVNKTSFLESSGETREEENPNKKEKSNLVDEFE